MTDEELIRSLRRLDGAAAPRPEFADALLDRLRRERRRPSASRLPLLAAAVVGVTLIGAAFVVGQSPDQEAVIPDPPPRSPTPAPVADSTRPPATEMPTIGLDTREAIPFAELTGAGVGDFNMLAGADDAIWIAGFDASGSALDLVKLDAVTGERRLLDIPCGLTGCPTAMTVGPTAVWLVSPGDIVRVDRSGLGEPLIVPRQTRNSATSVVVDEQGRLWVGRPDGADLFATDGTLVRSIDTPFTPRESLGYGDAMVVAPVFGSLWAYDSGEARIDRLDPQTGEVSARIELQHCPDIEHHRNGSGHEPLIYPIQGVAGMADGMVVSCPMDTHHVYPGRMAVIDPSTSAVRQLIDLGSSYDPGVVIDGAWWVPMIPDRTIEGEGRIVRIDPASGRVAAYVDAPLFVHSRPRPNLFLGAGDLWVVLMLVEPRRDGSAELALARIAADELP